MSDVADPAPPESSAQPVNTLALWKTSLDGWGQLLAPLAKAGRGKVDVADKRFASPEWDHPVFDLMRQGYSLMADTMMNSIATLNVSDAEKTRMTFAMKMMVDAMSPANSPFTNPVALQKAMDTGGQSLMAGMQHMMADLQRGQLTHTDPEAFRVGENIAATPGKVVYQTALFQLLQYTPATPDALAVPLIIFPPWINRFYILDLTAKKSFIKWCVDQGLTVFVVSWKSADATMKDLVWDDYIAGQIEAIDTVRDLLGVDDVHAIGYCVAGTTLAATLSVLAAKGQADKVASATFFTAQVDFTRGGDLLHFIDDNQLKMIEAMGQQGFIDGRLLALSFNLLRGNDLIWSTVQKNWLMGEEYPAFDLLHWNGDVTNLPARWHKEYLCDLYRDNKLVQPGAMQALGVPIDLSMVETPSYIQAGREDHIAPADSVWKLTEHFKGPLRFVLAGSGHIAGVVNPPDAGKYQHWINESGDVSSLDEFVAGATEIKGSWWPDWIKWIETRDAERVPADGARIPGGGKFAAIEDTPGSYVKTR